MRDEQRIAELVRQACVHIGEERLHARAHVVHLFSPGSHKANSTAPSAPPSVCILKNEDRRWHSSDSRRSLTVPLNPVPQCSSVLPMRKKSATARKTWSAPLFLLQYGADPFTYRAACDRAACLITSTPKATATAVQAMMWRRVHKCGGYMWVARRRVPFEL